MTHNDLPLEQLWRHRCTVAAPADLAGFWTETLVESRRHWAPPRLKLANTGLPLVVAHDVTFDGFGGQPVRAWLHRPVGSAGNLPVVVKYNGYGGGRNLPHQVPMWTLAGYATFDVDNRGQGSLGGYVGDTDDVAVGPSWGPGLLTRGITDPRTYYLRRLLTDAVLAVDAVRALPGLDPDRVAVTGVSQGGGITLAVAGLVAGLRAVMPDVPFFCDVPRGVALAASGPYRELATHLAKGHANGEQVWRTLAYFDAAILASRSTAPALMSVALMDSVCPPSTVFGAFNNYSGPKELAVYPYNDHEGGQFEHEARQLAWVSRLL